MQFAKSGSFTPFLLQQLHFIVQGQWVMRCESILILKRIFLFQQLCNLFATRQGQRCLVQNDEIFKPLFRQDTQAHSFSAMQYMETLYPVNTVIQLYPCVSTNGIQERTGRKSIGS
ncbi:hypothetical protein D3C74_359010 [compost metagenome]